MICPKCGNQTADDAAFCGVCGTPMGAAAQPAVETPVQEQYQQEVRQQFEQPSEPVPAAPQQYQEYNTPDYLSGNAPSYGTPPRRYDEPVQQQFEQPVQQEQAPINEYQQYSQPEKVEQPFVPTPSAPQQQHPGYNTPVNLSNETPSYGTPQRAENGSSSLALGIVIIIIVGILIVVGIVLAVKGTKKAVKEITDDCVSVVSVTEEAGFDPVL
ncbi:MAG: zinc-ribbon domain-containing protein [Ruminococcus sp.]|nr:zinc-ribbon domain-containing protein [Ruminococcus sp.]